MENIDLLISPRWIIPVEPSGVILEGHSLAVKGELIHGILPREEALARFAPRQTLDLPDHALIPGLVNLHAHSAMSLLRGIADDLPLMRWLQEAIWPAEGRLVSHDFVRDGTLLAAAEMLRGGITTCNDMYFHPQAAAEAYDLAGMRAVVGMVVIDFPTPYASSADEYFRKGLAAMEAWHDQGDLLFAIAPHAPYTVSDENLSRCLSLAEELQIPIHMHVHETRQEIEESLARFGLRPLERLTKLGLLGPAFIAVHAVHLTSEEISLLARHQCGIAHCPTSNMKLASGIAPSRDLNAAGLNVGLGTDGAASNNRLDLFREMNIASLLAKASTNDATSIPAAQALRMATLSGAAALGLADRLGTLETGKLADLCAVSFAEFEMNPCHDPISHLVNVADRRLVTHVWVGGKPRISEGKLLRVCNTDLVAISALWQNKTCN
ncbi:MAG: TRZ/ATZ family hydrolase [Rhodocyclaceae bacterium]|jgi:5-methylthioadenosine/S-adenosylhomocysteine deaminase|nr:TRZ/ATZ family hydrolase [Rhodocyclaceae bacterium]